MPYLTRSPGLTAHRYFSALHPVNCSHMKLSLRLPNWTTFMFRILSVGNDPRLLATRAAVLRYTGAEVDAADARSARREVILHRYDLLILCHSVSMEDASDLKQMCRSYSPESRTLLLGADIRNDAKPIESDGTLRSLEGPIALIREVSAWMRYAAVSTAYGPVTIDSVRNADLSLIRRSYDHT